MRTPTDESMQKVFQAFVRCGKTVDEAAKLISGLFIDMSSESGGEITDEGADKFVKTIMGAIERAVDNKDENELKRKIFKQCGDWPNQPYWLKGEDIFELKYCGVSLGYDVVNFDTGEIEHFPRLTEVTKWFYKNGIEHLDT